MGAGGIVWEGLGGVLGVWVTQHLLAAGGRLGCLPPRHLKQLLLLTFR